MVRGEIANLRKALKGFEADRSTERDDVSLVANNADCTMPVPEEPPDPELRSAPGPVAQSPGQSPALRASSTMAMPAGAMRPSLSRRFTRNTLLSDHWLVVLRGTKNKGVQFVHVLERVVRKMINPVLKSTCGLPFSFLRLRKRGQ